MKATRNKLVKLSSALAHVARSHDTARSHLAGVYNDLCIARGRVPTVALAELVPDAREVRLHDFMPADGNVSALELLSLCLLARARSPRLVLELGTFDGNTALQIAANLDQGAELVTVDLPPGASVPAGGDDFDHGCVDAPHRGRLRFRGTAYENRIRTVQANTLELDFRAACLGRSPDFVFVDSGHSEECVRNDSRKSLDVLAPGGTIAWHDYGQSWPGVYNYLNELAREIALTHIAGTSIVVHSAPRRPE
jgi:predicted O-methyltransferase YrrM